MSFTPSKYQQDVFNHIRHENGNLVINAVAGSGKTTTLKKAIEFIRGTAIYFAFNKSISEELKEKLMKQIAQGNVDVSTIHSYGFSCLRRSLGFDIEIDNKKYRKILDDKYTNEELVKLIGYEGMNIAETKQDIIHIVNLARLNMVDGLTDILQLAEKHDIKISDVEVGIIMELIAIGLSSISTIDFTDMIYLPLKLKKMSFRKYDFILVDECQDLNRCQQELVKKAMRSKGRAIYVGDPHQAIYGFAGADVTSFNRLTQYDNTIELPLSKCYRCGSSIIDEAKKYVPHIEAFEGADRGEVDYGSSIMEVMAGDMILCRNTFPIIRLAMEYIMKEVKVTIMGRDIGEELINVIKNSKAGNKKALFEWMAKDLKILLKSIAKHDGIEEHTAKNKPKYFNREEKYRAIEFLVSKSRSLKAAISTIREMFAEKDGGIIMSTIHKAKGLEADNVYILHRDLMPSKYAKMDWEMEQEHNLIYVAYTRPKKKLGIISDYDAFTAAALDEHDKIMAEEETDPVVAFQDKVDSEIITNQEVPEDNWVRRVEGQQFIGKIGETKNFRVKILSMNELNGVHGKVILYKMLDERGDILIKFGSMGTGRPLKEGDVLNISATVKQHKEFKDNKETIIEKVVFNGKE